MQIKSVEILTGSVIGVDHIYLTTDMPNTFPRIPDQGNMKMQIDLQRGTSIQYLRDNFGNDAEFPATAILIDGDKGTETVISIAECLLRQ
jgi:hypothetical protein